MVEGIEVRFTATAVARHVEGGRKLDALEELTRSSSCLISPPGQVTQLVPAAKTDCLHVRRHEQLQLRSACA
jgi:hypothetical protein